MLEAGLVDKMSHPLDWTRSVAETIAFDKVVEAAQKYCDEHPDTLLIVTGDHTHSISVAGTVDDNKEGRDMREKVGVYAAAGYPNYKDENGDGFPDDFAPSKRLAVFFGAHPDYYETYRPHPDKTFTPAVKNEKGEYVANEAYKNEPGAHFVEGNLPRSESQGVHTVDDLVVTARGPNAEAIRGFMNSTEIFRVMAEASRSAVKSLLGDPGRPSPGAPCAGVSPVLRERRRAPGFFFPTRRDRVPRSTVSCRGPFSHRPV